MKRLIPVVTVVFFGFFPQSAVAETAANAAKAPSPGASQAEQTERVEVDNIKEKYWARGEQSELGVVQNRLYSKENKIELGTFGGLISSDPFLSTKNVGFSLGFHFSEYLAVHALAWKAFTSPSSALTTFEDKVHATTNNNPPRSYYGIEGSASMIYGKLSLLGKSILYYDMHVMAGVGSTNTDTSKRFGNYFTPHIGIGQQVFLSNYMCMRIDYRLMEYREHLTEKNITPKLGEDVGVRTNWTHAVTMGVTFFIGVGL